MLKVNSWRPAGWNNPHYTIYGHKETWESRIFEAGADAMFDGQVYALVESDWRTLVRSETAREIISKMEEINRTAVDTKQADCMFQELIIELKKKYEVKP